MEPRWVVTRASPYDEQLEFGPGGDSLPKSFGATVRYPQLGAEVELSGRFDGQRIAVTRINLSSQAVTPRLINDLTIAAVVYEVGHQLLKLGSIGPINGRTRPWRGALQKEMLFVAVLYWREHVTWGTPLRAIAEAWNLPDQTAHKWRQRAHSTYGLPD